VEQAEQILVAVVEQVAVGRQQGQVAQVAQA
jgi:hypothetical protein